MLICLPGLVFVLGTEYLAEITFWWVPLNRTPGVIWRELGYVVALGRAGRALAAWNIMTV